MHWSLAFWTETHRSRKLVLFGFLILCAAFVLHKPLPPNMTQRHKMHLLEPVLRIFYYYPIKTLNYFGFYHAHVRWARFIMNFFATIFNTVTQLTRPNRMKQVLDTTFDGVSVRVYIPSVRSNNGAVFFIHGGGYVIFNVDTYDSVTREISAEAGMVLVSVDYRLAPEHVYPTALLDCEKALLAFMTNNYKSYDVDPSKIVVMGDSAGATLATVVMQRFSDNSALPFPLKSQVLIYPLTQFVDLMTPSYQFSKRFTQGTSLLDAETLGIWMLLYLGIDPDHVPWILTNGHASSDRFRRRIADHSNHLDHGHLPFPVNSTFYEKTDVAGPNCPAASADDGSLIDFLFEPSFAPLMAPEGSLRALPDSLVITCEYDPLRDDGYWYYRRLKNEGVNATWWHYDQGFHGMMNFFTEIELAQRIVQEAARFIVDSVSK